MDALTASPLCPSPLELELTEVRFAAPELIVTATARRRVVACPNCGHASSRVHSECIAGTTGRSLISPGMGSGCASTSTFAASSAMCTAASGGYAPSDSRRPPPPLPGALLGQRRRWKPSVLPLAVALEHGSQRLSGSPVLPRRYSRSYLTLTPPPTNVLKVVTAFVMALKPPYESWA